MKKLFFLFLLTAGCLQAAAQGLYSHLYVYDRFDDVLCTKKIKTLIKEGENTITIETKGEKPLVYFVVNEERTGSRQDVVNLVNNLYGYERSLTVVPDAMSMVFLSTYNKLKAAGQLDDAQMDMLMQRYNGAYVTLRVLSSTRDFFEYRSKLAWVKLMDGTRMVFKED